MRINNMAFQIAMVVISILTTTTFAASKLISEATLSSNKVVRVSTRTKTGRVSYYAQINNGIPQKIGDIDAEYLQPGLQNGFVWKESLVINSDEFLFYLIERNSYSRPGGGQCGGGDEIDLYVLKVEGSSVFPSARIPVDGCLAGISLNSNNGDIASAFKIEDGSILIDWLYHRAVNDGGIGVLRPEFNLLSIRQRN